MVVLKNLCLAAALSAAGAAQAHVSVQPTEATAGSYQVLRFGVGHGCDGKATRALRIEIPNGVSAARPQPKPGWTLSVERSPDGATTAIIWTGALAADEFEEFLILTRLPASAGALPFPAIQRCDGSELRWVEIAPSGGPRPARPAPVVNLRPGAAPLASHDRHH